MRSGLAALVTLCVMAMGLRADFHATLTAKAASGDAAAVHEMLKESSEMPSVGVLEKAYDHGNVNVLEYILAHMRPHMMSEPEYCETVRAFFLRLARSPERSPLRERVIHILIPYCVCFDLADVIAVLRSSGDQVTLEKLRYAAESDPRIKFYSLEETVLMDNYRRFTQALRLSTDLEKRDAFATALLHNQPEFMYAIIDSLKCDYTLGKLLRMVIEKCPVKGGDLSVYSAVTERLTEVVSLTKMQNLFRMLSDSGYNPVILTQLLQAIRSEAGGSSDTDLRNKRSFDLSNNLVPEESDSLIIDGQGSWEHVFDELGSIEAYELTITNTGLVLPKRLIPEHLAVDFTATRLTLIGIPGFHKVPGGFFHRADSILHLSLSNLGIEEMERGALAGLPVLQTLDLSENSIHRFPEVNKFRLYRSGLTKVDFTGNPMTSGCIPHTIVHVVVPDNLLPRCDYEKHLPHPDSIPELSIDLQEVLPLMDARFRCHPRNNFIAQQPSHVYLVGKLSGGHYAVVFVLEDGLMLNELAYNPSTGRIIIYSTCVSIPMIPFRKDKLEEFARLMFTLNSAIWRKTRKDMELSDYLEINKSFTYGDQSIPMEAGVTVEQLLKKCEEYEKEHIDYIKGIDSCVTFAHVFYRDLFQPPSSA